MPSFVQQSVAAAHPHDIASHIQLDQSGHAINGFSKIHRLWVEVHFLTLASGRITVLAPEGHREHSIRRQLFAWNMGFVDRIRSTELDSPIDDTLS